MAKDLRWRVRISSTRRGRSGTFLLYLRLSNVFPFQPFWRVLLHIAFLPSSLLYIRIHSISCSCGIVLTFSAPYVVKMTTRVWRPFRRRWKRKRRDTLILFRDKLFIWVEFNFLDRLKPKWIWNQLDHKFYMKLYNCSTPIIIKNYSNESIIMHRCCLRGNPSTRHNNNNNSHRKRKKSYTISLYFIWYGVAGG